MNYRVVNSILGQIAMVLAVLLTIPLTIAIIYKEDTVIAFIITISALLAFAIPLILSRPRNTNIQAREGFFSVALSWALMSVFGSLPFFISGHIPNFIDSLFETISGFTTTGASILSDVEALPKSLLFWRSLTQWIGGMGVLLFVIAIIPKSNAKVIHMFKAELPGPQVGKLVSKLRFTARILYGIYIALTLSQVVLLLIGKMSLFDSFIYAFGTAGTGGFSNSNLGLTRYDSVYIDLVITVYMFLFSISFNIYYLILIGNFRQALRSEELRAYTLISLVSITILSLSLMINNIYPTLLQALRHSTFQVGSIMSTSGYYTADYTRWPQVTQSILLILMFIGACAGSTGGGLKVSRVIILFKTGIREIKKTISPRQITSVKFDNKPLDSTVYNGVLRYFAIYIFIIGVSIVLVSTTLEGSTDNFVNSFSSVISSINNIGIGFGDIGPLGNYSFFSPFAKIVLAFNMLAGRLEILPMLLLFYPKLWLNR